MDVCKCIEPLRHGGTLNSRRATSPLVWLVEGEERWEAPDLPQDFFPLNWGGTEQKRTATCMVLKAKANNMGHNVTVNGDWYRAMITNFFIPELNNHDVQELWFQQDGATCHTARAIIDLLKDTLGDRLISRFGPVNWPPRSCDLTPLDYFLWGYVKSLVYADKPQTLDHLEDNIRRVIADIRPQMLEKVIENWTSRLDYIRASRGSHMPEIIFKM
ncbi:DUF4817 domain-containing protein [Trichonephila clavipes]|uniref:DUF4817 domain-containing protein n=1 Tax=Trichonephila clavipes TaxID=2585209 RepID=A0A8X6VK19_TRICX|nr:DUF4817 domain-containing protein [Trichonephila clavipes]